MSFQIDGQTWEPKSTAEHTNDILNKINALLQENNVTDKNGNVVQLSANYANAFYLLALASGNRYADQDEKLAAAINSFNIELCDDQQIENLLPIAAVERNPGSYSTVTLSCTASAGSRCVIPAGTRAPFGSYFFITTTELIIDNRQGATEKTETVQAECNQVGPVIALKDEINAFEGSIAGLAAVTNNSSSIPGVAAETTNELRQRLIQGNTIKYTLEGCKDALESLTGIAYARVYFNYNTATTITLGGEGGVVLQPRTAYIVVYGAAYDGLAEIYSEYMNAPTQNAPGATTTAKQQPYVTNSGQQLVIKYDIATEKTIHVKILLEKNSDGSTIPDETKLQLKRDLLAASSEWEIGQNVTGLLAGQPFINTTYAKVAYCEVSENGTTWTQTINVGCNVIPRLTDATIDVQYVS